MQHRHKLAYLAKQEWQDSKQQVSKLIFTVRLGKRHNKERRHNHENQLPEVYLERVIRACSNKGDLVMDPFLGSGTTGVVARALGRKVIGLEYSAANAKSAFERIGAGPIRVGEGAINQSSAIFAPRNTGAKSRIQAESR